MRLDPRPGDAQKRYCTKCGTAILGVQTFDGSKWYWDHEDWCPGCGNEVFWHDLKKPARKDGGS